MAVTPKKTDEVLASARKDLKAQLALVRQEASRLAAEEGALTAALATLGGDSAPASAAPAAKRAAKSSTPKRSGRRARRRSTGGAKSTADRVKELEGVLADGPKSRNELAAALTVSPARVQQLLAALGKSVTSEPAPGPRQGKLWSLKGRANGASAARKPAAKRRTKPKSARAAKASSDKVAAVR